MKSPKPKRRWLRWLLAAGLPVLAAGGLLLFLARKPDSAAAAGAAPRFQLYTVEAIANSSLIEVSGNLEPIETEDIGFAGSGKVAAVYVEERDPVRAGDLIAELDSSEERYDLASLDYQIQKARISGSESQLALLQLEREMKLSELQEKKVWTTISGVVAEVDIREGEYVKTGELIEPIVRIIDLSAMRAEVEIDELDVPRVAVGQPVRFHIDALPELEVVGRVSELPLEGRVTSQGITVLDAEVMIDDPPKELLPGYSFTAEIQAGEEEKHLVLNKAAVLERGGRTLVLLSPAAAGEPPTPREVETASYDSDRLRILSGLSAGDVVVAPGTDGAARGSSAAAQGGQTRTSPLSLLGFPQGPPGSRPPGGGPR